MRRCYNICMKRIAAILAAAVALGCCACGAKGGENPTLGVWWWNSELAIDEYLGFAVDNGVTEVYYCDAGLDSDTAAFVSECRRRDIDAYFLAGEYQWLDDPSPLYDVVERYIAFNGEHPDTFSGVHLDIEPHQSPDFAERRGELIYSLVSLAAGLKAKYPSLRFDYDIPFWLNDEITFGGDTLPAYAHMILIADRVFIMSYRDTAEAIFDTAADEIAFAEANGKTPVLGVETYSEEGDSVSFLEEGKRYMYGELDKLRGMLSDGSGLAIHHIETWRGLKD